MIFVNALGTSFSFFQTVYYNKATYGNNYLPFPFAVLMFGGFEPPCKDLPQAGHFAGISLNVVWQPGHL
jgi:hypothetical protein